MKLGISTQRGVSFCELLFCLLREKTPAVSSAIRYRSYWNYAKGTVPTRFQLGSTSVGPRLRSAAPLFLLKFVGIESKTKAKHTRHRSRLRCRVMFVLNVALCSLP